MADLDWQAVARMLATTLNPRLPAGMTLRVDGMHVEFYAPDGWWGTDQLGINDGLDDEVERILSSVQDTVAHATRGLAWPSHPLPMPWAQVAGDTLTFGYGDEQWSAVAVTSLRGARE